MKKIKYLIILTLSIFTLSCSSDGDSSSDEKNDVEKLLIGLWEIDKIDGIEFPIGDSTFNSSWQIEFKEDAIFNFIAGDQITSSEWNFDSINNILTYDSTQYVLISVTETELKILLETAESVTPSAKTEFLYIKK